MGESSLIRKSGAGAEGKATGKSSGVTVDSGPYVGVVVKSIETTKMGQLRVYIADWDSEHDVSYASPFYGKTYGTDTQLTPDHPVTAGQSYGMWMVPPDLGCKVLVTFVAGDASQGYWFACIYDSTSHHMVPGIGRNVGGPNDLKTIGDDLQSKLTKESVIPVVESSTADPKAFTAKGVTNTPRFPHEFQMYMLLRQGLDRDKVRGAISSSSLRENPSNVYGISTPGRKLGKKDQLPDNKQAVFARTGGHQFVMDDGSAADGTDQLIRLRTTGGHQILMNDTENILYVASASGAQWLEFSKDGSVNVFAYAGFNVRSSGPLNLHSDTAVLINSGGTVAINGDIGVNITSLGSASMSGIVAASLKSDGITSVSALGKVSIASLGPMSVGSSTMTSVGSLTGVLKLNLGQPIALPVIPTLPNDLIEVTLQGSQWIAQEGALNSICTVVPCHEPWVDGDGNRPKPARGKGILGSIVTLGAAVGIGAGLNAAVSGF